MAGDLRLRHREAHVGEEPACAALADVPLGLDVRLGGSGADRVEPELGGKLSELRGGHARILPVKAIRIHEDGGPDVLRYEDVPEPVAGPGEVLVSLRAASLNHLDLWVRKGLPSVPKPRILGADGAGVRVDTGERVVINPGLEHGATITVIGEHTDGTHAELIAVPEQNVFPLDDALDFETAAAFPLVYETAYRMLVTKAQLREGETVLIWGIGGGVATASFEIARALGARTVVTSGSDEKLARAVEWGADVVVNHRSGDVAAAVKEAGGADVVVETVGEATWKTSLGRRQAWRARHRVRRDERAQPARAAAPVLVEAADGVRLDDGHARGLPRRLRAGAERSGARARRLGVPARGDARRARAARGRRAARQDRARDPGLAK